MRQEVDRERRARENEIRRMREQSERERMEKENAIQLMLYEVNQKDEQLERERKEKENALRRMREKEEQNEREIADLRNKLSQASLMTPPQVNQICDNFLFCYIIKYDFQHEVS